MVREAVVLAGGLGTRLRGVVKDVPKPMADINGKPFLCYLFDYLISQGINRVILSVGYKWDVIKTYFSSKYEVLELEYAIEHKPLGTGGGLKNAISYSQLEDVFVLNGDTLFCINLSLFYKLHTEKNSKFSIALKKVEDASRYGTVEIDESNTITGFLEKGNAKSGLINGGIYLVNKRFFLENSAQGYFSLEKDFLEVNYKKLRFYGFVFDGYFIDIGLPEDYERAKKELEKFQCT